MTDQEAQLAAALDQFSAKFADAVTSVSRVVNPLLELWSMAHDIRPELAAPLEGLLSALPQRVLTSHGELSTAIDQVRLLLASEESRPAEVASA